MMWRRAVIIIFGREQLSIYVYNIIYHLLGSCYFTTETLNTYKHSISLPNSFPSWAFFVEKTSPESILSVPREVCGFPCLLTHSVHLYYYCKQATLLIFIELNLSLRGLA